MTWVAGPEGERVSPLSWSLPLPRIAGICLRLHWVFLAAIAVVLLRSFVGPGGADTSTGAPAGPALTAIAMGSLLVIVVVRELVRAMVVRASGGTTDDVPLWPLGALGGMTPASGWRGEFAAALVGPCVSAVIFAALAIPIGLASGEWVGGAFPDPVGDAWLRNQHPRWLEVAWVVHRTNVQVALLNLLPMVPLDAGLAMSALMLRSRGPIAAPRVACRATMGVAVTAAVVAILWNISTVLAVSVGCFVLAALAVRRIQIGDAVGAATGWKRDHAAGFAFQERVQQAAHDEAERADRQRAQAEADDRELDRVLGKIAAQGRDSLSAAERATLQRATEVRRNPPRRTGGE